MGVLGNKNPTEGFYWVRKPGERFHEIEWVEVLRNKKKLTKSGFYWVRKSGKRFYEIEWIEVQRSLYFENYKKKEIK